MADAGVPDGSTICFGSHAFDAGAVMPQVLAVFGYRSVAITGDYLHANPENDAGEALAV
jgi:hypothetical protein